MSIRMMWQARLRLGLVMMMGFLPVIILATLFGFQSAAASPRAVPLDVAYVSVNPSTANLSSTQVFTVAINVTSQETRASSFALKFDPAVIQCEAVSEGAFYSDWAQSHSASTLVFPVPTCNNISGTLSDMGITLLGGTGGPSGAGTLANVRFHALANGTSPISLTNVLVSDSCSPVCHPLPITLGYAQFHVGAAALTVKVPTSAVSVNQVFTASINVSTALPTRGVQFGLKFDPAIIQCEAGSEGTFYSDWAQSQGASTLVFPTPTCNNISGTLSDMGIAVLGANGQIGPTGTGTIANVRFHSLAAGTSPLSLTDVIVVDNCMLNYSCYALPTTAISNQVQIAAEAPPTPTVSVKAPTGILSSGQVFTASIDISTAYVSRAGSFGLSFDPTIIQCEAASEGTFYKAWAQSNGASTLVFPTPSCNNISGTLSTMGVTLLGGSGGPTGTGTLANVRFHALVGGTSPLSLTNVILSDNCVPSCHPLTVTLSNSQVQVAAEVIPIPTVSVNAPGGTITWNQPFTASINISTAYVSRAASFSLNFDPTRIRCEAASEGNFYKDWAHSHSASTLVFPTPTCNNISGTLSVMGVTLLGGTSGPTGSGTIANVRFHGIYPGQSSIDLSNVVLSDNCVPSCHPLTVTLSNSQLQIGPAPVPTATVAVNVPANPILNGQEFTASISISTAYVSRATSFSLGFDPTRIRCEAASEGTFYKDWAQSNGAATLVAPTPVCNNISGTLSAMGVTLLGVSGQGPTGTGFVANVRFQAIAGGTSPVTVSNVVVSNNCSPTCQALPVAVSNNQVQVKQEYAVYLPLILR